MSYVFYDTETTGTKTAYDQILQFAAVRTDSELNELERFEIRSRLLPHIVPAPGAMRVTGISVDQMTDPELSSHYEMARAIQAKLSEWSPAMFIGYNSIEFDEHLVRQAFYQTLQPPYLTNTDGNCRADAIRMARAAALYSPDALNIPTDEKGQPVFKLELIAPANGFAHDRAHEAMSDVEATIHVSRTISNAAPDLWSNLVRFAQKAAAIDYMTDENVFSLSDFYYGRPYSWLVTAIGPNPERTSEFFVFDLSVDPAEVADLEGPELIRRVGRSPKPVRRVRCNAHPILMPSEEVPDIATAKHLEAGEVSRRAEAIAADEALRDRLISAFLEGQEEKEPSPHVEEQIYTGFYDGDDQARLAAFQTSDWDARAEMIQQFEDPRLRALGQRLIYFERPDLLDEETRSGLEDSFAHRQLGGDEENPWLTLPAAILEADDLLSNAKGEEAARLQELRDYLVERLNSATATIS